MLPKIHRLHKDTEIKYLIKKGKPFFLPQLVIKYQKNKDSVTKIGFVVSTKVDKKAVVRNKLQRRLRDIIKKLLPDIKVGYSIMIIAKKSALELDYPQLEKQIIFALQKIKLI